MPVYNAEKYVKQSIQSVIDQSFSDWELLVVNNCSEDKSSLIVDEICSGNDNIRQLHTSENSGGPAAPRNIGVYQAVGKYLAFIDSDDLWHKEKLERQMRYVDQFNFICTLSNKIDENSENIESSRSQEDRPLSLSDIVMKNPIIASSVLVERDSFSRIMFDEDKRLNGFEDYNSFLRYIGTYGNAVLLGNSLVSYRVATNSLGSQIEADKRYLSSIYCLIKACLDSGNRTHLLRGIYRRYVSFLKARYF